MIEPHNPWSTLLMLTIPGRPDHGLVGAASERTPLVPPPDERHGATLRARQHSFERLKKRARIVPANSTRAIRTAIRTATDLTSRPLHHH
jgi:hypothetical protein